MLLLQRETTNLRSSTREMRCTEIVWKANPACVSVYVYMSVRFASFVMYMIQPRRRFCCFYLVSVMVCVFSHTKGKKARWIKLSSEIICKMASSPLPVRVNTQFWKMQNLGNTRARMLFFSLTDLNWWYRVIVEPEWVKELAWWICMNLCDTNVFGPNVRSECTVWMYGLYIGCEYIAKTYRQDVQGSRKFWLKYKIVQVAQV